MKILTINEIWKDFDETLDLNFVKNSEDSSNGVKISDFYFNGYKFNEKRMKKQKILLPINIKGEPDYEFMHNYMLYLEQKKILEYLDYIK